MNIGQAAKLTGLSSKTLRYYESIDLVSPSHRSANGYRDYSDADIEQLTLLQRARQTGFTIDECRQLLSLFNDTSRQSKHVKSLVMEKAERVEKQINELKWMHTTLLNLAEHCHADEAPQCGILDELAHPSNDMNSSKEANEDE